MPWQVLAAINEIETDYGRNLCVSSAGAVGWMQFLPSTWKTWGIDANGDEVADPYNPVDAIFSAARYLQAAGASKSTYPGDLRVQPRFLVRPVGPPAREARRRDARPADRRPVRPRRGPLPGRGAGEVRRQRGRSSREDAGQGSNAAIPIGSDTSKSVSIFAKQNSPVIAVNDGKIVKVGQNAAWGKFVQLQDQTGNIYTYAQLGRSRPISGAQARQDDRRAAHAGALDAGAAGTDRAGERRSAGHDGRPRAPPR